MFSAQSSADQVQSNDLVGSNSLEAPVEYQSNITNERLLADRSKQSKGGDR